MTEERIETLEKRVTTLEGLLADCMFQLDTVLSQPKSKGVAIPKAKGMAKQPSLKVWQNSSLKVWQNPRLPCR